MKLAQATKYMLEHGLQFVQNNPHDGIFQLQDATDRLKLRRLLDQELSVVVGKLPILQPDYSDHLLRSRLYQNLRTARVYATRDVTIGRFPPTATPTKASSPYFDVAYAATPQQAPASSHVKAPHTAPDIGKKSRRSKLGGIPWAHHAEHEALKTSFEDKFQALTEVQRFTARTIQQQATVFQQQATALQEHTETLSNFIEYQKRKNAETDAEMAAVKADIAEIKLRMDRQW